MGRKRNFDFMCKPKDNTEQLKMASKEKFQITTGIHVVSMPDLPIKVQRRIVKRRGKEGFCNSFAKPIYFKHETFLSPLYRKELSIPYIEQVFTSLKKIGNGSFGDVYEGMCIDNQKKYAIKVTNDNHSLINYGEVRRLENIPDHKHCVKFYGAWEQSYRVYLKMELCATSLDKVKTLNNHIKEGDIWDILVDIALGLQHLHRNKLIHLDVKPSNIMVTSNSVCKLGDFGLVYNLNDIDPVTSEKYRTGLSVSEGDGRYVAPEVLCDGTYTFFGDVYSFGLMMLEVASNTSLPSRGKEWESIRNEVLPDWYLKQDLSGDFRSLIESMIRRDHTKRPTMDSVLLNHRVRNVVTQHKHGIRCNFMADWDSRWQLHLNSCNTDIGSIPEEQIDVSPPRLRQNSVTNIPPWNRMPCQSNCAIKEVATTRFALHKKVVRKLF